MTLDQLCNPSELKLHYLQNKHVGLDLHGSPFHSKIFMLLFEKKKKMQTCPSDAFRDMSAKYSEHCWPWLTVAGDNVMKEVGGLFTLQK